MREFLIVNYDIDKLTFEFSTQQNLDEKSWTYNFEGALKPILLKIL